MLRLIALIEPHYPKMGPKGGRPAIPLETMLRVANSAKLVLPERF